VEEANYSSPSVLEEFGSGEENSDDDDYFEHAPRGKFTLKKERQFDQVYTSVEVENGSVRSARKKHKRSLDEPTSTAKRPKIDVETISNQIKSMSHSFPTFYPPLEKHLNNNEPLTLPLSQEKCQQGMQLLQNNQSLNKDLLSKVLQASPNKKRHTALTVRLMIPQDSKTEF